jgi:dTDP-4-amino-4,6-dideoxygalactose transaminase
MQIPLVDLSAQYQALQPQLMTALAEVLTSMQLFLGPQARAFEQEFAAYCGAQQAVGCASGTDALLLALRACEIGPGQEVITVANTFIATVEAIALVGATPVFVEIDPHTYTMDCSQLEQALTARTRAIVPVHLYGHPADMQPLLAFARAHGLRVIEDASQAHGATYQGWRVGSLGDIGCFSLYYSKNLGAYGEAGICVSSSPQLAERLRLLRDHGSRERYRHELLGTNSRLDELQAAILRVKLPHLDAWNAARQRHAQAYSEQLQGVVEQVPLVRDGHSHVFYAYVVQVRARQQVRQALAQAGIATGVHYPLPLHLQPACAAYGYRRGQLPVTEATAERIVSLPMYPELRPEQIQRVVDAVKHAVAVSAASC